MPGDNEIVYDQNGISFQRKRFGYVVKRAGI